jgi:hypothetical protein
LTTFPEVENASRRALELDPNLVAASRLLITVMTERGQLLEAYRAARDLVQRRPDSGDAHFALSYVLRYAGLLSEAARECHMARSLDPTSAAFRSCATVFLLAGDMERAREFLRLDEGTNWNAVFTMLLLMREGRNEEAIELGRTRNVSTQVWPLMQACAAKRPENEIADLTATLETQFRAIGDPENLYWAAGLLADCGRRGAALKFLRHAVEGNYCAYPAMESDPSLATIRNDPEFAQIRKLGIDCQNRFLAQR